MSKSNRNNSFRLSKVMEEVLVRRFEIEDAAQVKALTTSSYQHLITSYPSVNKFVKSMLKEVDNIEKVYLTKDGWNFWVAVDVASNKVIGTIAIQKKDESLAEIVRLGVDQEFRRKGIASMLLSKLEAFAKEQNYQTISLTTLNLLPEAIEFYQKNNYKIIKTTDIGKDVGLVTMTKSQ